MKTANINDVEVCVKEMIYNLKRVTGAYVKGFCNYVKDRKLLSESNEEMYDLFSYAIKVIHGLPACEHNYFTEQYGDDCISYLKKVRGVPRKIDKLGINDRISIVTMCKNYYAAVSLLADSKDNKREVVK